MIDWKEYIASIVGCSLFCGIVNSFWDANHKKDILKLVTGIFLTLTILSPLTKKVSYNWNLDFGDNWPDTDQVISDGIRFQQEETEKRIQASCEAYILEKANLPDTAIDVDIQLDKNQIPRAARIQGKYTDQVQTYLEMVLESDFGITKENQQWIGMQENSKS